MPCSPPRTAWPLTIQNDPVTFRWHIETRGFKVRDDSEARRIAFILLRLNVHEAKYLDHLEGAVGKQHWAAWESVVRLDFGITAYRNCWKTARALYAPAFVAFVDELLTEPA